MNRNLRATAQRKLIVEELRKLNSHPTANEIYEIVRAKLPKISLGTVYRNLEILSESGLIQKLEMAGSQRRFDGTVEDHFHVKCISCERVSDAELPFLKEILDSIKGVNDYKIVQRRLEFSGLCPQCRNKNMEMEQPEVSGWERHEAG